MEKEKKVRIEFSDSEFKKPSLSHRGKKVCVQVARRPEGVGVRDSKDPDKTTLQFTTEEWRAFIAGVKAGEFDL